MRRKVYAKLEKPVAFEFEFLASYLGAYMHNKKTTKI